MDPMDHGTDASFFLAPSWSVELLKAGSSAQQFGATGGTWCVVRSHVEAND